MKRKELVLVGAGHANLEILVSGKYHTTLINPLPYQIYSGRVSAFLSGEVPLEDCKIDVSRLADKFICEEALEIKDKEILTASGSVPFEEAVINTGSKTKAGEGLPVKPWDDFLESINSASSFRVTGSGFAAYEIAMCLRNRGKVFLSCREPGSYFRKTLLERGIELSSSEDAELSINATGQKPLLPKGALHSPKNGVYLLGDCSGRRPMNGVHAMHQGKDFVKGRDSNRNFHYALQILDCGDGTAISVKGKFKVRNSLSKRTKTWLDTKYMRRFS